MGAEKEIAQTYMPQDARSGTVRKTGCAIRYVRTDTRSQWDGEGIRGTEHSRWQRACRDAFRGCQTAAVLPRELAASMLFGHAKGAFTDGADTGKRRLFDMAKGGTLFLDEIGTMPFEIQSMLLRVLQENTYIPIGGNKERVADVRIVGRDE